jgi:hypothetical protein
LADVDAELLMEEESVVWTSKDVVIVLEHKNEKIPLRYVKTFFKDKNAPWILRLHGSNCFYIYIIPLMLQLCVRND